MWIGKLKAGEKDAVRKLWSGYFGRLVNLARAKLRTATGQATDEEDVALSAFDSFVRAVEAGRFPDLEDRNDLWQILVMLAGRKAITAARKARSQKRGGGKVRAASQIAKESGACPLADMMTREPDPALAAELADECQRLLAMLPDDLLRQIATLKLEGRTNEEIGESIGRAVPTVERKLKRIRESWKTEAIALGIVVD
jgi:DNA-directed RNA polymerase specialized sigma24 family protein